MNGYIHSYESLAAVDGDGLRYAVFMAGCPLRCIYCHNPDTWDFSAGTEISADALVNKVARYKTYFGDNGGVTFSGGEPLFQADFIKAMIPLLEKKKIGYIIDTAGSIELNDSIREVLAHSQSVLLDIKFWDAESYRIHSGCDIKNVIRTLEYLDSIGKKTVIRTVVIPGINDSEDVLQKYIHLVKNYNCIEKYELLGFHTMGFFKYENLKIENKLIDVPPLSPEKRDVLQTFVNNKLMK